MDRRHQDSSHFLASYWDVIVSYLCFCLDDSPISLDYPCGHSLPKSSDKGVAGSQKRQGSGKLNYNGGEGRGGGMEFGTVGAKMDIPGFENAVFM